MLGGDEAHMLLPISKIQYIWYFAVTYPIRVKSAHPMASELEKEQTVLNKIKSAQLFLFFFSRHVSQTFFLFVCFEPYSSRIWFEEDGEWECGGKKQAVAELQITDGEMPNGSSWEVPGVEPSAPIGRPSSDPLPSPSAQWMERSNQGWWCSPSHPGAPQCAGCCGEECCHQTERLRGQKKIPFDILQGTGVATIWLAQWLSKHFKPSPASKGTYSTAPCTTKLTKYKLQ